MITFKQWQQLNESLGGRTLGVLTPQSVLTSDRPLEGDALEEAKKRMKKKMLAGGNTDPDDDDDTDKKRFSDDDSGKNSGSDDDEREEGDDDEAAGEDDGDSEDADSDPRVKKQPKKVDIDMMKKKMKKESIYDEAFPWMKGKDKKKDDGDDGGKKLPPWMKGKDKKDDDKGDDKDDDKGGKKLPPWMKKGKCDDKPSKKKDAEDKLKKIRDKVKDESEEAFDAAFFASLTDGCGSPNQKYKDGWTEYQEDALLPDEDPNSQVKQEPGPGEVGFAPTGRYGEPLGTQVAESKKRK